MGISRHTPCCVVLVGDARVGKTSLVNRLVLDKFSESYCRTSGAPERSSWSLNIAKKRVDFTIWDTCGTHSSSRDRTWIYREANVFMLCYKISDPASLFSALNFWCPEIRAVAPSTPIILVGCQSDHRNDREVVSHLSRSGLNPVSAEQGLSVSHQAGAVLYVETSSKSCARAAISAFEVAGLTSLGQFERRPRPPPVPPKSSCVSPPVPPKPRRAISQMALNKENLYSPEPIHKIYRGGEGIFVSQKNISFRPQYTQPMSPRLSFKTSRERSNSSLLSLGQRTPKMARKNCQEKTVKIKCQRLTEDKQYEEVEVEVPAPIYETLKFYNESPEQQQKTKKAKSFTSKLRDLFVKH